MIHVVLYQPEIPPNTDNIIRLCANTGATLHLVHPLGFRMEDRRLRRAGLDYHEWAGIREHASLESLVEAIRPARLLAFSTRGRCRYTDVAYRDDDALLFGPETRGLPDRILRDLPDAQRLYIPMQPGNRSLNLSNAVAIATYEAWRQQHFAGSQLDG